MVGVKDISSNILETQISKNESFIRTAQFTSYESAIIKRRYFKGLALRETRPRILFIEYNKDRLGINSKNSDTRIKPRASL